MLNHSTVTLNMILPPKPLDVFTTWLCSSKLFSCMCGLLKMFHTNYLISYSLNPRCIQLLLLWSKVSLKLRLNAEYTLKCSFKFNLF